MYSVRPFQTATSVLLWNRWNLYANKAAFGLILIFWKGCWSQCCGFGTISSEPTTPKKALDPTGFWPETLVKATPKFLPVFRIRIHWFLIRIRIQHFRLKTVPIRIQHFRLNTVPIRIQSFDYQNFEKIYCWNFFYIYLTQGLHKGRPSYRRSLQPSNESISASRNKNCQLFFYFCGSFLPSWIRIPDTNPLT
jgi:hypothetical protein